MRAMGVFLMVFSPVFAILAWLFAGVPHGSTEIIQCAGAMLFALSWFIIGVMLIWEGNR
jgi:hypothetical protein